MAKQSAQPPSFNHMSDAAPEYVDVVLWHRVFLALGAVTATLAGIGFLVFQLMSNPAEPEPLTADILNPDTLEAPAAIPDSASAVQKQVTSTAEGSTAPHASNANATDIKPDATTTTVQPDSAQPDSAPVIKSTPTVVAQTTASTPTDKRFTVTTDILAPIVKRAVITDSMRGREPGPPLRSTQHISQQSTYSLYQFIDIRGQAGDSLTYHWKRNGQTLSKVRIPVGSDKWRNYASKVFNQNLKGNWQVDVTNSKGILLARSRFYLGN